MNRKKLKVFSIAIVLLGLTFWYWKSLPNKLFDTPWATVLESADGQLLGAKIARDEQWRFPAGDKVPSKFQQSLLQFEDSRFFSHFGVDPLAIARAFYLNLRSGRVVSGGSTISMQVIRLSRKNKPRSYFEKIVELILATRLELRYSKQEILAFYASHAPFGGNVVGLEAASWRYFGRKPSDLSWAESATLAVLPNSPALIHPGKNRSLLLKKRNALLEVLKKKALISPLDLQLALAEALPEKPHPLPRIAPHLLDTLSRREQSHRLQTTLNAAMQLSVNDMVSSHSQALSAQGIHNLAALVIDNQTSKVLAYVGNSQHGTRTKGYAIDLIHRSRSSGSTLKPFLFSAMLDAGDILPTTLVADIPVQYSGYRPRNFDRQYRGAVPAQEALIQSLNVPAVSMLRQYGVDKFYDYLQALGMTSLFRQPDDYGLTLILGGAESTLWDLASMYANLARASEQTGADHYYQQTLILNHQQPLRRPSEISPAAAWLTLDALVNVNRPGEHSFWRQYQSAQKIAWKTGTSYGFRDAWAIGMTPKYTVAVWAGNANGEGRPELVGSKAAAPLMLDIFKKLPKSPWFEKPTGQMKAVDICVNDGYLANGQCDSKTIGVPVYSYFNQVSPHNKRVHLDKLKNHQVHSRCENRENMVHENWFILPPSQAHFYRRTHASYRVLPDFRKDCQVSSSTHSSIDLIYPNRGSKIYIPIGLDNQQSSTVFRAVHRNSKAKLYWHLDDDFIGTTETFHEQAITVSAGRHRLLLVDDQGERFERYFEVIGTE